MSAPVLPWVNASAATLQSSISSDSGPELINLGAAAMSAVCDTGRRTSVGVTAAVELMNHVRCDPD
jgi:hypothetical protein